MTASPWQALDTELERWPTPPALWLRDDDAVGPAPPFERLAGLCARHAAPLCAAVIPARLEEGFADWLERRGDGIAVAVHGFAHLNHAPAHEKKSEFGDHRPATVMAAELAEGRKRAVEVFGARARPVFVPPWNRIGTRAAAALGPAGYAALSAKAPKSHDSVTGVTVADVHIDIIDWRGGRVFRGESAVLEEVRGRLEQLRHENKRGEPTGILTHHAVHDAAGWTFLENLLERTGGGARWVSVDDAVAAQR